MSLSHFGQAEVIAEDLNYTNKKRLAQSRLIIYGGMPPGNIIFCSRIFFS